MTIRWSNLAAIGAIGGALGLFFFGCDVIVVNDFPGGKGWGTGNGTGASGAAGGHTGNGGGGEGGQPAQCNTCHGNDVNSAPPLDMNGLSDPTLPTVGSHQQHLLPSTWHKQVACYECHTVPLSTKCPNYAENHCDGKVDLVFGPLSNTDGAITSYDMNAYTCSGNYCHGNGMSADADLAGFSSIRVPQFNLVDGTQSACGAGCHTNPPGDPHTTDTNCADSNCHGMVILTFDVATQTATWVDNGAAHIDGIVDAAP